MSKVSNCQTNNSKCYRNPLKSETAGGSIAGVTCGTGAGSHVTHNLRMTRTRDTRDTWSLWLTHPAVGVVATGPDARIPAVVVVAREAVAAVAVQVTLAIVSAEYCSRRRDTTKIYQSTCSRSRDGSSRSSCCDVALVWAWDWPGTMPLGPSGGSTRSRVTW